MADHRFYQHVANDLERGWAHRSWRDGDKKCLVQALRNWSAYKEEPLEAVLLEVHEHLLIKSPEYRGTVRASSWASSAWASPSRRSITNTLVRWNDRPLRQKSQVVSAIRDLAHEKEFAWLRDQGVRLSIEMSALREQIAELKERVRQLEHDKAKLLAENARLHIRVLRAFDTGYKALRTDQETLAELNSELSAVTERYATLGYEQGKMEV